MKTFSIKETIKRGWEIWKGNKALFTILLAISLIIEWLNPDKATGVISVVLMVVFGVISYIMGIGWMKIMLKLERGESATWKEVMNYTSYFWKYLGVTLLLMLISGIGFILLIVPGVYWFLKYQFAPLLVIDKDLPIKEAFKESARMTDGVKWKLLGLIFANMGVVLLGVLALFVGLIVAIPVAGLSNVVVYRKLQAQI